MIGFPPARVGVIGFGRFGRLWAAMLRDECNVVVYDSNPALRVMAAAEGFVQSSLGTALDADVIFYCVPISAFEAALREHLPYYAQSQRPRTLVDVLSVKEHPRDVFDRLLPPTFEAMLTHPMFGPDSVAVSGLAGQTIVLDRYRMSEEPFAAWTSYLESKGLVVVTMTAEEHDRLAAESQGVTHFVGRTLERFGFAPTAIDTLGTRKLHEITAQVTHDSEQLFIDLQTLNPFTAAMRVRLSEAQDSVFDQLLPNRLVTDLLRVGIQGGQGASTRRPPART